MSILVSAIHNYEDKRDTKLILEKYPPHISAPAARLGMIDWRSSDEPVLRTPPGISKMTMWFAVGILTACEVFLARTFFLLEKIRLEDLASFYVSTILIALILRRSIDRGMRIENLADILMSLGLTRTKHKR